MKQWLFAYGGTLFVLAMLIFINGVILAHEWMALLGATTTVLAGVNLVHVYQEVRV